MARQLDGVDEQLLELLTADSRTSIRALAEQLHVSRANAYARVQRLVEDGVIRRFTIETDPAARGLGTTAYVTLNLRQAEWRPVLERLVAVSGVVHVALVGGDFDVLLLVRAHDNAHLRRVVLDEIQAIPEVVSTRTLLVFEEQTLATTPGSAARAPSGSAGGSAGESVSGSAHQR